MSGFPKGQRASVSGFVGHTAASTGNPAILVRVAAQKAVCLEVRLAVLPPSLPSLAQGPLALPSCTRGAPLSLLSRGRVMNVALAEMALMAGTLSPQLRRTWGSRRPLVSEDCHSEAGQT